MSAEAAFYNNFGIWKYFFRQKKMRDPPIKNGVIAFVLYDKYFSAINGEGDIRVLY